MAVKYK